MSHSAPTTPPQYSSSTNNAPSTTKLSQIVEGSLEDITEQLDMRRNIHNLLQKSHDECSTFAQQAGMSDEYRNMFMEDARRVQVKIAESEQDMALLVRQLEDLQLSGADKGVIDGNEPVYLSPDEVARRRELRKILMMMNMGQAFSDLAAQIKARENAREIARSRKHKFGRWWKF